MDNSVSNIVQEVITDMTTEEKYLLVKDIEYGGPNDITVGQIVSIVVREELTLVAKQIFNSYLKTAQVNFNDKMDKRKTKTVMEDIPETTEDKIMTLKQRIRQDSKQLDDKEMREQGMI